MRLTFLGTGTSKGVPEIGCTCPTCLSTDKRDKRLRVSVLIETDETRILIDCGPDFRTQMLGIPFDRLDGVLLTHEHYDHTGGIDDLRPFAIFGDIDVYADDLTHRHLRERLPYFFREVLYPGVPRLLFHTVQPFLYQGHRGDPPTSDAWEVAHPRIPYRKIRLRDRHDRSPRGDHSTAHGCRHSSYRSPAPTPPRHTSNH